MQFQILIIRRALCVGSGTRWLTEAGELFCEGNELQDALNVLGREGWKPEFLIPDPAPSCGVRLILVRPVVPVRKEEPKPQFRGLGSDDD